MGLWSFLPTNQQLFGQGESCVLTYRQLEQKIKKKGVSALPEVIEGLQNLAESCESELRKRDDDTLALIHHKRGVYAFLTKDFSQALEANQTALHWRLTAQTPDPIKISHSHLNLAKAYDQLKYFNEVKRHLRIALDSLQGQDANKWKGESCFELGSVLIQVHDYYPALDYLKQALGYYEQLPNNKRKERYLAKTHLHQGIVFEHLQMPDSALYHYQAAKIKYQTLGMQTSITRYWVNYAKIYYEKEKWQEALFAYHKADSLLDLANVGNIDLQRSRIYNGIGMCQLYLGNPKEAREYLQKTLQIRQTLFGESYHASFVQVYENLGELAEKVGKPELALDYYQQAILQALPGFRAQKMVDYPNISDTTFVLGDYNILLRLLQTKAKLLVRQAAIQANPQIYQESALAHYQQADRLLFRMRREQIEVNSRLFWVEKGRSLYEPAISLAVQLGDLAEAFRLAERSKASVLLTGIRGQQAANLSLANAQLLETEKALNADIYAAEIRLEQGLSQQPPASANEIAALRDSVTFRRLAFYRFVSALKTQNPTYLHSKYEDGVASIQEVQTYLQKQQPATTLIQWFVGEQKVFAFVVQPDKAFSYQLDPQPTLIQDLLNLSMEAGTGQEVGRLNTYRSLGYEAFSYLLGPAVEQGITDRLLIIPDGQLARLPFEALLTEQTAAKYISQFPFLLRKYTCGYAYSASVLLQVQARPNQGPDEGILGVAPIHFRQVHGLKDLPGTQEEIAYLIDAWGGTPLVEREANRQKVWAAMQTHQVLHFATHAFAAPDVGTPYIVLADTILSLPEIYTLQTPAELVVLSACLTQAGQLHKGEGIMSLTRAFRYVGVPSCVASFWQANDLSTSDIIKGFYAYLKEGYSKDEALRQAKLDFIESSANSTWQYGATPFYWAHLIHTGDSRPMELGGQKGWLPTWGIAIALGMLLVGGLIWFVFRPKPYQNVQLHEVVVNAKK